MNITLRIIHINITLEYREIPLKHPRYISPPEYTFPKYVTQLSFQVYAPQHPNKRSSG